jgi:hypothetical protein
LAAVSYLLPASIHTPTVAVWACGVASVATRMPLGRVVTCAGREEIVGRVFDQPDARWIVF